MYVDESVEEAYESRKKWPAQNWEYDAWVSTYTAIKVGEQAGVSNRCQKGIRTSSYEFNRCFERKTVA